MSAIVTEWGTDYWGEILSEPTEDMARSLAEEYHTTKLYRRVEGGDWKLMKS